MSCREATFVNESTIDFPIFLLFFNTMYPIFPVFSILSFLFSYFFEQPCCWTACSCQSKQLSRCCINFPLELTCQIVTNQSIKIGRRAWPTCGHDTKRSSPPVFLKNWLNFRVRGQFEIKILIVRGHNDINTTYFIWIIGKNKLEPAIIWNW